MQIAQIMLGKGFGGAERSFVDICRELAARGHEVCAIVEKRSIAREVLENDVNIELKPIPVLGNWDLRARYQIASCLDRSKAQIVHAHLARAAHLGGSAAARTGIPVLVKTHNYVDLKYYRYIDHFVCTTRDQRHYLANKGVPATRLSVIPNFSRYPEAKQVRSINATPSIIAYGRLVEKKGFKYLIEALQELNAQGLKLPCTIAGDGPLRGALQEQVLQAGLQAQILFAGWVAEPERLLDTHDVFVLPSLDEPFGIVVLEAMARGLPIISTRTQGPREILDDDTALFCEAGDAHSLLGALREITEQGSQAHRRAQKALDKYRAKYCADAVVPQYLNLYETLLSSSTPS